MVDWSTIPEQYKFFAVDDRGDNSIGIGYPAYVFEKRPSFIWGSWHYGGAYGYVGHFQCDDHKNSLQERPVQSEKVEVM